MLQKKYAIGRNFGPASFYAQALKIAIPVMAQMLIQNLVSLIDNFMVAGLGDVKMSGVNICGQIIFVFMVFMNTICMAGGIFMTQFSGAKDKEGMKQSFCFKLWMGLFVVAVFSVSCFLLPRQILSFMVRGNSQAVLILDQGVQYMRIMGFMGIPWMLSAMISSSLREIGKVKVPLVISIIATCVNTVCNWILIYGNLGVPRLEVRGAAIATVIARTVEALIFIGYMIKQKPDFAIKFFDVFRINFALFCEILKKAWMIMLSEMVWAMAETITTALYNGRGGADVVSGMSSSFAISNLFFVAFNGIITATGVIIGKDLGRGELDQARQEKVWLLNGSKIFGLFFTGIGFLCLLLVPVVFRNLSASSQHICRQMVLVMAIYMPIWVYINCQFAVSRAGGDTVMGMVVDGIGNFGIVIPGIFLLANFTGIGPVAMYAIIKFVEVPKIMIAHFWLKKEKWLVNLAQKENEGEEK
ncbi:putative efflux protein, MATE family [Treponema bryantii]|uniref:Putative efflux protein, MATE family n=1 Tax=Treponema bryantii TaxID=163 RepID=A0A1I3KM02_9SPIR|nr:MATE family efflux transporter [Treponema bryantii]SFI73533.1 putative efflux protein, MATE family [Treponema bryantii]